VNLGTQHPLLKLGMATLSDDDRTTDHQLTSENPMSDFPLAGILNKCSICTLLL
jgi:hypothetical protein